MRGFREREEGRTLGSEGPGGLERLCKNVGDGIQAASIEAGVERIAARFQGNGFDPHRHDTYAIGLTVSGVQTFWYRAEKRFSLPGQVIILHPDEVHDGGAGTENGLFYRMIYVPPEKVAEAAGWPGKGLPFVPSPVLNDQGLQQSLVDVLQDLDLEMGSLKLDGFVADLAEGLQRHADDRRAERSEINWRGMKLCRDYLRDNFSQEVRSSELESVADLDRFSLARQFRKAFGTTPHRYQVLRRLEAVKDAIRTGNALADAAADVGFADQSHMSRHFKRAYGMTPGHWRTLCLAA